MNLSIRTKLLFGFGAVLFIMLAVAFNNYFQIKYTTEIQNRLTELHQPTVTAGLHLKDGINLSLAGLRGYMILGKDPDKANIFKAERYNGVIV